MTKECIAIEPTPDEFIQRIKLDLMYAEKARRNAEINVIRLERELQSWEMKKRMDAAPVYDWRHSSSV